MTRVVLLGLIASVLAGCATAPPVVISDPDWPGHSAALTALEDWSARGKISLRSDTQADSANLNWVQRSNNTRLELSGPLGMGAARITSDGQELLVDQGGELQRYDISSRAAVLQATGWDLPMGALHYWLKGLPAPGLAIAGVELVEGRLARLEQAGWIIQYRSYGDFDGYALPTRLELENEGTRMRLMLRNWTTGAG